PVCKGGDYYTVDCNLCKCDDNGQWVCTTNICDPVKYDCPGNKAVCDKSPTYARDPGTGGCCPLQAPCPGPADLEVLSSHGGVPRDAGEVARTSEGGRARRFGERGLEDRLHPVVECAEHDSLQARRRPERRGDLPDGNRGGFCERVPVHAAADRRKRNGSELQF